MRRCRQMQGGGLIEMNVNYRSAPAVVDFINGVMRHMMSADTGGVDYTGGQMLEAGAGAADACRSCLRGARRSKQSRLRRRKSPNRSKGLLPRGLLTAKSRYCGLRCATPAGR